VPLNIELAAGAFILSLLIGLASSAYPAVIASRLDPNEALRAL
jgi:ABC-type antimicrobial peptide transport system permease subunit